MYVSVSYEEQNENVQTKWQRIIECNTFYYSRSLCVGLQRLEANASIVAIIPQVITSPSYSGQHEPHF